MKQSCIHIYCGDGKGKSTAVTGLAVRAAGSGRRVIFTQFMKDGKSSELKVLRELPGVTVLTCEKQFGFFWNMTDEQKKEAAAAYQALFDRATELAVREDAFLLVMDEFMSCYNHGMLNREKALDFLKNRPEGLEVALTGRDPARSFWNWPIMSPRCGKSSIPLIRVYMPGRESSCRRRTGA